MEAADIKKLFPLTTTVTQEIIDNGLPIGDQLLKQALPEILHDSIFWGLSIGSVKGVLIETEKSVEHNGKIVNVPFYLQRSDIKKPGIIIFKLRTKATKVLG